MTPARLARYRKYYVRYSGRAPFALLWHAMRARSKIERLGLVNRQRDYLRLKGDPKRLALHRDLLDIAIAAAQHWSSYDYGQGYFYQSCAAAGISGLRDTEGRVKALGLRERTKGRTVLDIGCNAGFVDLALAAGAERVDGFDINPYLVQTAERTAAHLGLDNVVFTASSFEDLASDRRYDVVLSLANHSTYDENTRHTFDEYFAKCARLLRRGGTLLFESHPPQHEKDLEAVCEVIGRYFAIGERAVHEYGTFLDRGRTFLVATRRD